MRLRKQVNINNTFRVLNFNLFHDELDNSIIVNGNEKEVLQALKDNDGSKYTFIILHDQNENILLNEKVFKGKGRVLYYTSTVVPSYLLFTLANRKRSEIVYKYRENFTQQDLENMRAAFEINTVAILVTVDYPKYTPKSYLFSLNDTRFIANKVYYQFTTSKQQHNKYYYRTLDSKYVLKPAYVENFFDESHEVLARWKLQLYLSYHSKNDFEVLNKLTEGR